MHSFGVAAPGTCQPDRAILDSLRDAGTGITLDSVAERFTRAHRPRVEEILSVLVGLGLHSQ